MANTSEDWSPAQFREYQRTGKLPAGVAFPVVAEPAPSQPVGTEHRAEGTLQRGIIAYLTQHRKKGTVAGVINPPMNRRSTLPSGWPDITFAYRGKPVALEVKLPGKNAEPHQIQCHERLRTDGWLVMIVHSVADVGEVLNAVDHAVEFGC